MDAKSRKEKGRVLEAWLVKELKESGLDSQAYRTPGSGSGLDKADVFCPRWSYAFECKNTKTFGVDQWRQAQRQAVGDFTVPLLMWHPPKVPLQDSLIVMRWEDLKALMQKSKEPRTPDTSSDLKWKLQRAVESMKAAIKAID